MSDTFKYPKNFPDMNKFETKGIFWETQDMEDLNSSLINSIISLKAINKDLTKYERKKSELKLAYKRKYRETYLKSTVQNATDKKFMAEIECQELEWKIEYLDEVIRELTRESNSIRLELDTLKTLGHNLRQEMRL